MFIEDILQALETDAERMMAGRLIGKMAESLISKSDDHKRRGGRMNALEKEYYDFGPWLIEIKQLEDIPQQYMPKRATILGGAKCSFKVPIKKEWRNIHPGMLLYNTVIAIHDDKIIIYKAVDIGIEESIIDVKDIRYLVHSTDLLDSHIIIGTDVKLYDVDYNSVSQEISNRVIDKMRTSVFRESSKIHFEDIKGIDGVESIVYNELMQRESDSETFKVLAFQPFVKLEKHNPTTAELLLQTHKKYDLQDAVLLTNGKELIVVNRNKEVKRSKDADYSFRHTFIRLDDIAEIKLVDDVEMIHLKSLVIYSGDSHVTFKVSDEFDLKGLRECLKL